MKRRAPILAALLLLLTSLLAPLSQSVTATDLGVTSISGSEPTKITYSRFVTAVVFLWGDSKNPSSWDPAAPDSTFTVHTGALLPAGASQVSLSPYDPMTFDLDNSPNVIGRKDSNFYLTQYYPYGVNNLALSLDGQPDGSGKISYSYTMKLTPNQALYDVREKLEQPGGEQEIRDLMEYVSPTMEQFLAKDKERAFGETIEAYLYFVPYLIQYQIPTDAPPPPAVTPPAIDGSAVLVLPPYSYEGHPVPARDRSSFTVDGSAYSAQRLYAEELGDNQFTILESGAGTCRKLDSTLAELVFQRAGRYSVRLDVETAEGSSYSDTESILIRKTPYIVASLSGTQKQNRRQDLMLHIATHPEYPLREVQVSIQDSATGEVLRQEYVNESVLTGGSTGVGGSIVTGGSTDHLKMRPMSQDLLNSDSFFTTLDLPFLTKPTQPGAPEIRTYHYSVYAVDFRGETHSVEADYTVAPDLAPAPQISMDQTFLRDKGTNVAWLVASDDTVSQDGDGIQREWEYTSKDTSSTPAQDRTPKDVKIMPGYQALSFGTNKRIGFQKEGVGGFQLRLSVTDQWAEPTLEEFILPGDVLTGSAIASAQVDNVAPVISRQTQKIVNRSILLIGGSQEELDLMKHVRTDFLQEFLRNGIDAQLQYALLQGETPPQITDVTALSSWSLPYGVEANGSMNEPELFAVDETNLYLTLFTWPKQDGTNGIGAYPGAPVRVVAYDPYTGAQRWTYTTMDATRFAMGHDDTGTYLYLLYPGTTILLDKATGTIAGQIPSALGKQNFLTDRFLYSANGTNLIQIDLKTLASKTVWSGASGVRRIGNQLHFFTAGSDAISRGILDLESSTVIRQRLVGKSENPDYSSGVYQCVGMDSAGTMVLWKNAGFGSDTGRGFRVYDIHNQLIYTVEKSVAGSPSPAMSLDEQGICNHVAVMEQIQSSSCTQYETAYNIRTGASAGNSISQTSSLGYPTNGLIAAFEARGQSYFIYGSSWVYIVNYGLYSGQKHYTFTYNGSTGLAKSVMGPANLDVAEEYGTVSDRFAAFFLGDNTLGSAAMRTKVLGWPKTLSGEIAQVLYRFADAGTDDLENRKHIILYDNSNSDLASNVDAAARRIQETGASFLFAAGGAAGSENPDALSNQSYGSRIAALVDGIVSLVDESSHTIAEVIGRTVLEEAQGYQPALLVTVTNSEGTSQSGILQSTRKLQPGRQYFYEYDLKQIVSANAEAIGTDPIPELPPSNMTADFLINRAFTDSQLLPENYYVTKVVEEDFNDGVVDSFFTPTGSISGGRFGIFGGSGGTRNLLRGGSASLKFTVPEGKRALISMDYAMYHDDHGWQGGISIDGQRFFNNQWNSDADSSYSGSYQHPLLLLQGVHTIDLSMSYYGYGTVSFYSALDNLRVIFVDLEQPGAKEQHGDVPLSNDWVRVQGNFTAPGARLSYGAQALTYLDGSIPAVPYDTYRTNYALTIPSGMIGKILTYPEGSAWGTSPAGPYFSIGGKIVYMLPETNYPWRRISSGQQVFAGNLTGSNLFYSMGAYRASGSIPRFQQFLYPASAAAGADRIFFSKTLSGARDSDSSLSTGGWDRVYLENESADGSVTLRIALPAGEGETQYLLQNLRFYYYEKGIKTYVEDTEIRDLAQFTDPSHAARWVPSSNITMSMTTAMPGAEEVDSDRLVFQKGQLVSFPMFYRDYEADPSKRSYYRYLHEPMNDGLHPDAAVQLSESGVQVGGPGLGEQLPVAGRPAATAPAVTKVLADPIQRFQVDGKYILQHWQEDQTSRSAGILGTDSPYDKLSNVEEVTFYIESGSQAPWITYIKTLPGKVKEGASYQLEIGVDDSEKDELRLRTEVYWKGELLYVHQQTGIKADLSGTYPPVSTGFAPEAEAGIYQVVCTVRDALGAGVDTYRFQVLSEGKLTGFVQHTMQWDRNRKNFNLSRFGSEHNEPVVLTDYQALLPPRPRGTNVFWSGEKLMVTADLAGQPQTVKAEIVDYPTYNTSLERTGETNQAGEAIYAGSLWDGSMIGQWGRKIPEEVIVKFSADYPGGTALTFDVPIVFDNSTSYWNLHRAW